MPSSRGTIDRARLPSSITGIAPLKFEKGKETAVQITIRALTDPSVTTANKVGKWFEA